MKKINKAKYAILGMLTNEPQSGYEIKRSILGSVAYFWQESDASIYPMLKTLQKEGLVTSQREYVGKRGRVIFAITPAGKKALSAWLKLPAEDESSRNELLLKLFFSANVTKDDTIQQLLLHQEKLAKITQQFKQIEEGLTSKIDDKNPHKLFWRMVLRNGILQAEAESHWLEECFKLLNVPGK